MNSDCDSCFLYEIGGGLSWLIGEYVIKLLRNIFRAFRGLFLRPYTFNVQTDKM